MTIYGLFLLNENSRESWTEQIFLIFLMESFREGFVSSDT